MPRQSMKKEHQQGTKKQERVVKPELFDLGDIIIRPEVQEVIIESKLVFQNIVGRCVHNFSEGRWGSVDEGTAVKNRIHLRKGEGRLVGIYETPFGKLEIATNGERKYTNVKFAR